MRRKILISNILAFTLVASVCRADSAYQWTDEQGRVFFGSKPPKNATGVAPVKANNYSRYKPSPALTKMRKESRARLGNVKETDLVVPPKDSFDLKSESPTSQTALELSVETPVVKVGSQQEIQSCVVTVKNQTPVDVQGIQVSFEFPDGTLIPAAGPARLNTGQASLYIVGTEQLPLKLQAGSGTTPKVIVNTDGETVLRPVSE